MPESANLQTQIAKATFAKVLVTAAVDEPFDYLIRSDQNLTEGTLVSVPFGRRQAVGVVWELADKSAVDSAKLKSVTDVFAFHALGKNFLRFIESASAYNMTPLGNVLKLALPVAQAFEPLKRERKKEEIRQEFHFKQIELSDFQQKAAEELYGKIKAEKFSVTVLDGVTGSGKTEVYFEAIAECLKQGRQAVVMLPEISLTVQWLERFKSRFGVQPTLWHSGLTPAQRRENWKSIINGEAKLVAGARSSLFLPYPDLGLIVVDEEHDTSYKQEEGVIYNGRDMAVLRASCEGLPVVLASATPSLETVLNCRAKRYDEVTLPERHGGASMPSVSLIDMKQEKLPAGNWLSSHLKRTIAENLASGNQTLLYLNRRGFAPLTLCRACGSRVSCPDCSTWLVYHKGKDFLLCHHCGFSRKMPNECESCKAENSFVMCGPGVERLAKEVEDNFTNSRVLTLASDSTTTPKQLEEAISKIEGREVDIIIGTQMAAKGHHFPKLTLVGVVDADMALGGSDLRAAERTYQMLHQVSGRAGRESDKGKVLIQSYMPEHPVMQALKSGNRDEFLEAELAARKSADMPPFSRLAAILLTGADEGLLKKVAGELARKVPHTNKIMVMGPVPAPISVLKRKFRYRFLIKAPRNINVQQFIKVWLGSTKLPSSIAVRTDVDPISFI